MKIITFYNNFFPRNLIEEKLKYVHRKTHICMLKAALLIIVNWNEPKCLSFGE